MKKMIKVSALLISLCLLFCVSAMAEEPKSEILVKPTCTSVGQQLLTFSDGTTKIVDIPMTPHAYEWVTVTEPTCTKDGEQVFKCKDCKAVDPKTDPLPIEKLGHKPGEAVEEIKPTCTEKGLSVVYCTECTEKLSETEILPLGHKPGEAAEEIKPTCTEKGLSVVRCSECNEALESKEIPALGHELQWVTVTDPTCTVEGLAKAVCETCEEDITDKDGESTKILKKKDHSFGEYEVTEVPTCNKAGVETRTCTECGYAETREIPIDPDAHKYGEIQVLKQPTCEEDGIAVKICGLCGDIFSCIDDYYWVDEDGNKVEEDDPTAVEKYYPYHKLNHPKEHQIETIENEVAYTCTTDGSYEKVITCDSCKKELSRETVVVTHKHGAPTEPVKDEESVVEATCTEPGFYDMVTYCSICGDELSREMIDIPELPHTPGEPAVVTEPTCTQEGLSVVICTECKNTISEEILPAKGHDYGTNPVLNIITPAKCGVDGKAEAVCQNCDQTYEVILKALEHVTGEPETVDPTCDAEGSVTVKCKLCGDTVEYTPLSKLDHVAKEAYSLEPTCVNPGKHYFYCENCDDHYYNELTGEWIDQYIETEVVPLDHDWGDWILVNEATDTTRGFKYRTCSRGCGYTENVTFTKGSCLVGIEETHFIFDGSSKPVGENKIVKPADGHKPGETVVVTEASCTKDGLTEVRCTVCNEVLESIVIPVLEHIPGEAVVVTEATCTKEGLSEVRCTVCEKVLESNEIPALGHTEVEDAAVEPTCTTTGLTAGSHCSVCDEVIVAQEELPMLAHVLDEGVIDPVATPDKPGVRTRTCILCGTYTETEEVPYEFGKAVYSITKDDLTYSAGKLTGVAHHDVTTETLENLYVRVTFFLSDNTTVVTETFVHEDGTFNAFSNGDIVAISVVLTPEEGTPIKEPGEFETWETGAAAGIIL